MMEQSPFELGWSAGLAGEDPRLCPYEKTTREWREWQSFHGKAVEYARALSHMDADGGGI